MLENLRPYVPNAKDASLAQSVAKLTHTGTMLPKTPDQITELFEKGHSVVLMDGEKLASHAALTYEWGDGWHEVGGVCTDPDYRKHGLATKTVEQLLEHGRGQYPEGKFFALANSMSAGLFKKIGGVEMLTSELPEKVWEACAECPMKPAQKCEDVFMCCDTPYNLTTTQQ